MDLENRVFITDVGTMLGNNWLNLLQTVEKVISRQCMYKCVYSAPVVNYKVQPVLYQRNASLLFRLSDDSRMLVSSVGSILVPLSISAWVKYDFTERFTMEIAKSTSFNTNLIKSFYLLIVMYTLLYHCM